VKDIGGKGREKLSQKERICLPPVDDRQSPQEKYHTWSRCLCSAQPPSLEPPQATQSPRQTVFGSRSLPGSSLDRISISFFEDRKEPPGHRPRRVQVLAPAPQNNPVKNLPASELPPRASPPQQPTTASLLRNVQIAQKIPPGLDLALTLPVRASRDTPDARACGWLDCGRAQRAGGRSSRGPSPGTRSVARADDRRW
jgi:hypothetical protein